MSLIVLLTLVCMVAYTIEIIFGLAGTILMVTTMSYFMSTKTVVIYSILPQLLVATIGLYRSPRTVKIRFLAGMVAFASLGAVAGLYLFYYFSMQQFHLLLSSMIVLFGLYLISSHKRPRLGPWSNRALDTLAGASQALFGISGPIAMTRLLGSFEGKTRIRNYALAFFLCLNMFRAGGYLLNGTITPDIREMMLFTAPLLAITLWYSNHLHFHINETVFKKAISWMILLGGVVMFFNTPVQ